MKDGAADLEVRNDDENGDDDGKNSAEKSGVGDDYGDALQTRQRHLKG